MKRFSSNDYKHMAAALELACRVKGTTNPNPAVGAVLVKNGRVVGKGATQPCGGLHAEIVALRKAGRSAAGATMYVSLEPCAHVGRTPPCTESIIAAGVHAVVVGCLDANPLVSGKGVAMLRRNGIRVAVGLMSAQARMLNEDFFWSITSQKPWITLKLAMTLDGKIADTRGSSRWITNKEARKYVHELRRRHAAIAVGHGTLRADNPSLTVRHVEGASPTRIVFASSSRAGRGSFFRKTAAQYRSIIVCPGGKAGNRTVASDNVELWHTGTSSPQRRLDVFTDMAYSEGLTSILVEGGAMLASSLLRARLVNRLYLFYGNCILGSGYDGFRLRDTNLQSAVRLSHVEQIRFGDNIAITGLACRK